MTHQSTLSQFLVISILLFCVNLPNLKWVNLTQMTIIYTTAGKNPLEEME